MHTDKSGGDDADDEENCITFHLSHFTIDDQDVTVTEEDIRWDDVNMLLWKPKQCIFKIQSQT